MKNNSYRILSAVVAVLFVFLTGCSSYNLSVSEKQAEKVQNITDEAVRAGIKETTETVIQQESEEALTGWVAAYKTIVDNTLKECSEKYPDETHYGAYGLYDFDRDDIPELFLKVYGSIMSDSYISVYDFNGEEGFYLGGIESAHSWIYGTDREKAFLAECSWMGVSEWRIYKLENGEFISEKIASYYPDGFGENIKPQENPLPGMGYDIEKIECYFLDDLSGIGIS